jgi:sugar phosphate isomerase/epimerase
MIRAAVTVSLVDAARGGPFVYWDDLEPAAADAASLGFHALEIFPPSPDLLTSLNVTETLARHHLDLAAVGTGAGWVLHGLSLTCADALGRRRAKEFVKQTIDIAGSLRAPTIIGSMQGRAPAEVSRETALSYLGEALHELGNHARQYQVPLLIEPLNRYETNLLNTVQQGVDLITRGIGNVKLLCDLFHMNIEEVNIADSLRVAGNLLGHIHWADSNRRAAGLGHTAFGPIAQELKGLSTIGYVSAEVFPLPSSHEAAAATMNSYKSHFESRA